MKKRKNQNYVVNQTDYFLEELYEILDYMCDNLYSSTPSKFTMKITKIIDNLEYFPKMYAKYPKNIKYRRFLANNYIIFYKVDDITKIVDIVHIYYNRKDSFNLN